MERHTVFMNWKTHHCKDFNFSQTDLYISCNFDQDSKRIFFGQYKQTISKISMGRQKNKNNQNNFDQKEKVGGITLQFRNLLLSYSSQEWY